MLAIVSVVIGIISGARPFRRGALRGQEVCAPSWPHVS